RVCIADIRFDTLTCSASSHFDTQISINPSIDAIECHLECTFDRRKKVPCYTPRKKKLPDD
ncbi:hypothetical protein TNIN_231491, partial [Trichonephila inaurata madagascariensis]